MVLNYPERTQNIISFFNQKFKHLFNPYGEVPINPYSKYLKKRDQFGYVIKKLSEDLVKPKPPPENIKRPTLYRGKWMYPMRKPIPPSNDSDLSEVFG